MPSYCFLIYFYDYICYADEYVLPDRNTLHILPPSLFLKPEA